MKIGKDGPTAKAWFITGTSRGFGREWAIAALGRGDTVAATARDAASLQGLVDEYGDAVLPLPLDVTDRAAVYRSVARAHDHFGRLDVIVNNAGYGQFGMIEEISEREARDLFETNVFAPCGSPRRPCRTSGSSAAATSNRCRRSAACRRFPTSASTTPRSGP
jgi:NAD(P)-dependent dehydrogenase (short-subunit alcohol dehydrogenase family)